MRALPANAPLYLRMFTIVLACVGAVQMFNVGFVILIGPPLPRIYSIEQVAVALRRGTDPTGEIVVSPGGLARDDDTLRNAVLRAAFSRAMAIRSDNVRIYEARMLPAKLPLFGDIRARQQDVRREILIGGFTIAVRQADGSWLSARPARTGLEQWRLGALVLIFTTLMAVLVFAWLLTRRVARPIGLFADAAERLGRDPRAAPVPLEGPPEIAHAARAFNDMQRRLNRYVEDRTIMIGAIAHDLKTPLMRLALQVDQLPDRYRGAAKRAIAEMDEMIGAATDYVRDVSRPGARRRLDLRALAETVADDLADQADAIIVEPGERLVIDGDPVMLKAILNNLVGNALRYAGDAVVTLRQDDDAVTILVRDHGPGIPAGDLDHVFEPFFRSERSRNRATGGIGLGLASVGEMVRAHGGEVEIRNHPDGGVLARVSLPLHPSGAETSGRHMGPA